MPEVYGAPYPPIPSGRLIEMFDADLDNGKLLWKKPPKNHNDMSGKEAGYAQIGRRGKKYWKIQIDGRFYERGKLIYAIGTGGWAEVLDHINGDSLDDRLINLRTATIKQNVWNRTKGQSRCGLPMGIRRTRQGKFQVRIACHGKTHYLGVFETVEAAQAVYAKKRVELFGEFSGIAEGVLNA